MTILRRDHDLFAGRQNSGRTVTFWRTDPSAGEPRATWTVPALPPGTAGAGFSPDLMTWYYSETAHCEGDNCTYVMLARDLETGRDREIFRISGFNFGSVSVSQDGRSLAFRIVDMTRKGNVVMVAPTAGGPPRELIRLLGDFITATAWTPDGGHVLAFCSPGVRGEVWSIPTEGGLPVKSALRLQAFSPAVSPDGTQVAFIGTDMTTGEIWVMTGLFPDAKRAGPASH